MRKGKRPIEYVILCDDVRIEANGKHFIIGVYSGNIVIGQAPATLGLCVFASLNPLDAGSHTFEIQLSSSAGSINMGGELVIESPGPMAVSTPPLPVTFPAEGDVIVRARVDEGEWHEVMKKKVILASSLAPSPSIPA